jgi:hypothetical protein
MTTKTPNTQTPAKPKEKKLAFMDDIHHSQHSDSAADIVDKQQHAQGYTTDILHS